MNPQLHIAMKLSIYQGTTKTVSETNSQTRLHLILRNRQFVFPITNGITKTVTVYVVKYPNGIENVNKMLLVISVNTL